MEAPSAPSAHGVVSAAAASAAVVSASAASATPSAAPVAAPRLERPAAMSQEHFDILSSLCGLASFRHSDGQMVYGCRSQPPFDRDVELPDGTIVEKPDVYDVCSLHSIVRGSFTKPGADQAILGFDLCKTDTGEFWNGAQPGFAMLVERVTDAKGSHYRYLDHESDINVFECSTVPRKDGTLSLVCEDNFGAYGDGAARWLFALDFSAPPAARFARVVRLYMNSSTVRCGMENAASEYGLTDVTFGKRTIEDLNGDGEPDLSVEVSRAHVPAGKALDARIAAGCKNPEFEISKLLPRPTRTTLRFLRAGTMLSPDDPTAKKLKTWADDSSSFWVNGQ